MTSDRFPITCHVLDTTTGRPGAGIAVTLRCQSIAEALVRFEARTNHDGRITEWKSNAVPKSDDNTSSRTQMQAMIKEYAAKEASSKCPTGSSVWTLGFETGAYYGLSNTFFPQVELKFLVKEGEHFHVPLLLGPYSFTTYRGS